MIVELLLSGASYYLFESYSKREFKEYKKEFDLVIDRLPVLKNNKDEKPNLLSYEPTEYGYKINFLLPVGVTTDTIHNNFKALKEAFKLSSMHFSEDERLITLHAIK